MQLGSSSNWRFCGEEGSGDLREAFSNSAASGMAGFDMLAMLCRVLCGMLRVETKESEGFLAVRDCGYSVCSATAIVSTC